MSALDSLSAKGTLAWLVRAKVNPIAAHHLARHGIADTATIEAYADRCMLVADLPDDVTITDAEISDFVTVGAHVWLADPENREEWAGVGRRVDALDAALEAVRYGHAKFRGGRHNPDGSHRGHYQAVEAVTDLYNAGRGPAYARALLTSARLHLIEVDAYGYGEEITPTVYRDLAEAGIPNRAALAVYEAAGIGLTDAVGFAAEGIPAAAVLMAKRDGIPVADMLAALRGIPAVWFRPITTDQGAAVDRGEFLRITHYIRDYTIADLRFVADHGWGEKDTLAHADVTGASAADSRMLAEHGMTWANASSYATALTVGKVEYKWSTHEPVDHLQANTLGPLVRSSRRSTSVTAEHVPIMVALWEAGVKPSHLGAYRAAGAKTVADILHLARDLGVDHKTVKALLDEHGATPNKWKPNLRRLRLVDTFRLAAERAKA